MFRFCSDHASIRVAQLVKKTFTPITSGPLLIAVQTISVISPYAEKKFMGYFRVK